MNCGETTHPKEITREKYANRQPELLRKEAKGGSILGFSHNGQPLRQPLISESLTNAFGSGCGNPPK